MTIAVVLGWSFINNPGRPGPPFCVKAHVILVLGLLFYFGRTHPPDAFLGSKHEPEGCLWDLTCLQCYWFDCFFKVPGASSSWPLPDSSMLIGLFLGFPLCRLRFWWSLVCHVSSYLSLCFSTFWGCIAVLSSQSLCSCEVMLLLKSLYCNAILLEFQQEHRYPQLFNPLYLIRSKDLLF